MHPRSHRVLPSARALLEFTQRLAGLLCKDVRALNIERVGGRAKPLRPVSVRPTECRMPGRGGGGGTGPHRGGGGGPFFFFFAPPRPGPPPPPKVFLFFRGPHRHGFAAGHGVASTSIRDTRRQYGQRQGPAYETLFMAFAPPWLPDRCCPAF